MDANTDPTPATAPAAAERHMANAIRALAMDAVETARSGHPGMPMGMADVATVLFNRFMRIDPADPVWPDRDRFVLSAGHGSMLIYALHHLIGYDDMGIDQLRNFRQLGSRTAGHPEYGHAAGIETTTGPLGQGIANAVGMALAERMLNSRFGDDLVDHDTYVIAGDGCLMEGVSHEAADLAGNLSLGRLIVLWDDNGITIDGATALSTRADQMQRFAALGWHVAAVDGHDRDGVARAIDAARNDRRPSLIACRTVIGFGAPNKQGTAATHGAPLGGDEIALAREMLEWPHPPFTVPDDVRAAWKNVAARGARHRDAWAERHAASPNRDAFDTFMSAETAALGPAIADLKNRLVREAPTVATRQASQTVLEVVNAVLPGTVGGSADLTGSNNTRTDHMTPVTGGDFSGRYIHYGVREHGMAAAMNGIALHGGLIPYGGTFLVFSDYCRPSIRLSALMGLRVVYVMTHDSIGLGEDGPTHQPVEHLAALRAIPNLNVFRPADAVETAEAWEAALSSATTPSVLCLSRQGLPTVRESQTDENMTAKGAYVLRETAGPRDVTLIATGSEVKIALSAATALNAEGINAAVVSAPCVDLFAAQPADYRAHVLGGAPRVGIEAGVRDGLHKLLGDGDAFVGMAGFGASAPAGDLYRHFAITPDAAAAAARTLLFAQS